METHFASGERAEAGRLAQGVLATVTNPIVQTVLESVEGYVVVLNPQRQVLAANTELLEALGLATGESLEGLRFGEVMGCSHLDQAPSGCGTSRACSQCGAVLAVLAAQAGAAPANAECWLSFQRQGQLVASEFRVRATSLEVADLQLVVLVLVDISAEKRRDVLESLFFHDVSNTLQGLWAMGEVLEGQEYRVAGARVLEISRRLKQALDRHRLLIRAEAGTLEIQPESISVAGMLKALDDQFGSRAVVRQRELGVRLPRSDWAVLSDPELVLRILENMVINALEACAPGERVEVWADQEEAQTCFHVRNPGQLDPVVALRIFQRSFSTKGSKGRGLGTFSMKLFGETFLKGRVFFRSEPELGTTFTLALPEPCLAEENITVKVVP